MLCSLSLSCFVGYVYLVFLCVAILSNWKTRKRERKRKRKRKRKKRKWSSNIGIGRQDRKLASDW